MTTTQPSLDLFSDQPAPDEGLARMDAARKASRRTDPPTSAAAYRDTAPRVDGHKKLVLDALRKAGDDGLTDAEAAAATGLIATSAGKRRKDLMEMDPPLVEATDMRRPTPTGSSAIVWRIK